MSIANIKVELKLKFIKPHKESLFHKMNLKALKKNYKSDNLKLFSFFLRILRLQLQFFYAACYRNIRLTKSSRNHNLSKNVYFSFLHRGSVSIIFLSR